MMQPDEIQVVALQGPPRERGRVYGETLRPLISQAMGRWKESIGAAIGLRPDDYLDRFVNTTDFIPAIERWAPHLLIEVRGIADGAGLSFRDAYAYQLMDEEWLFRGRQRRADDAATLEHCSVVGIFGEGARPTILAQNMDLPKYYDGAQTVLRVTDDDRGLESMIFTPAGLIATCGLTNAGLGLCVNTLAHLGSSTYGLPVAFVARRILEQRTLDEAIRFMHGVAHASGQNYAIGDPTRIIDLECSAAKVVPFAPGPTRVYHTNHPLVNDDHPARGGDVTAVAVGQGRGAEVVSTLPTALSNSQERFAFLERALADGAEHVTVERVQGILSTCDVPISVGRASVGTGMTLGSLVMELSLPSVVHLAAGPPAETAYRTWTL